MPKYRVGIMFAQRGYVTVSAPDEDKAEEKVIAMGDDRLMELAEDEEFEITSVEKSQPMSREVHFVVAVDVDQKKIYIDDDTYAAKFDYDQGYWDTEQEKWLPDEDRLLYDQALAILNGKAKLEED